MEGPDQSENPTHLLQQASSERADAHAAAAAADDEPAAARPATQIQVSPEQRQLIRRSLSNSIAGETAHLLLNADAQQNSVQNWACDILL